MDIHQVTLYYNGSCFALPQQGHGNAVLLSRVPPPTRASVPRKRVRQHKKSKKVSKKPSTPPNKRKKVSPKTVARVLDSLS